MTSTVAAYSSQFQAFGSVPAGDLPQAALAEAVDPWRGVQRRAPTGGPAPSELRRTLDPLRDRLESDESELTRARARVAAGAALLEQAIDHILRADQPPG